MTVNDSDLEIMKCLLSDPRMMLKDVAQESSLSYKTVARRLEMMRENNVLQFFTIIANLSSFRLIGYIEFATLIHVKEPSCQSVVERVRYELQEHFPCFLVLDIGIKMDSFLRYSLLQTFPPSTRYQEDCDPTKELPTSSH
jgi:DNA-binding Lrp family transcriptional regulator